MWRESKWSTKCLFSGIELSHAVCYWTLKHVMRKQISAAALMFSNRQSAVLITQQWLTGRWGRRGEVGETLMGLWLISLCDHLSLFSIWVFFLSQWVWMVSRLHAVLHTHCLCPPLQARLTCRLKTQRRSARHTASRNQSPGLQSRSGACCRCSRHIIYFYQGCDCWKVVSPRCLQMSRCVRPTVQKRDFSFSLLW